MIHTKYSRLSKEEFISLLESKAGGSELVDECIQRLIAISELDSVVLDSEYTCPICEARVIINEKDEDSYSLKSLGY